MLRGLILQSRLVIIYTVRYKILKFCILPPDSTVELRLMLKRNNFRVSNVAISIRSTSLLVTNEMFAVSLPKIIRKGMKSNT
jgi:hypothetical protein